MMSEFTVHICAFREVHLDGINYSDGINFFSKCGFVDFNIACADWF